MRFPIRNSPARRLNPWAGIQRFIWLSAFILSFRLAETAFGDNPIGGQTSVVFASVDEGRKILTTRDDFIERLSPFDRAARMKTDADVSESAFLKFIGTHVLEWSTDEKGMVDGTLGRLKARLETFSLPFPNTIYFVKTTGNEEGGQPYTRHNAIMLNPHVLVAGQEKALDQCVAHELFHVLSRHNPELREKCYAAVGFHKCPEVVLPRDIQMVRLTDPDAPKNDHYIQVTIGGKPAAAVPILYSRSAKYDVHEGGEFFRYLQFKFLIGAIPTGAAGSDPVFTGKAPRLLNPDEVSGFFEQIGKNTQYIIHPEEILADNFSMLIRDETKVTSPEVLERLKLALAH